MSTFTLKNKLTQKAEFILGPTPLINAVQNSGILPMPTVIEDRIGTEMALLLVDKTPFIKELSKLQPFDLHLKTGLVRTSHGPVMFLLFYIPTPGKPHTPFMMLDYHVNPFDPSMVAMWRDLARQTHWHVILVDGEGTVFNLLEFSNVYGLGHSLDQVLAVCEGMDHGIFAEAKEEFSANYSLEDLYSA
jgi:hypothetical protein